MTTVQGPPQDLVVEKEKKKEVEDNEENVGKGGGGELQQTKQKAPSKALSP